MKQSYTPQLFLASCIASSGSSAAALYNALSGSPLGAAFFGGLAVFNGLFTIRFAIAEVTSRAKPQGPASPSATPQNPGPSPT